MWELKNLDTGEVKYSKLLKIDHAYRFVATSLEGDQYWIEDGGYHRLDGPAITEANGTLEWYQHDLPHREDGPAVIYNNGTRVWYWRGKRHREDGPAMITHSGQEIWYIRGVKVDPPAWYTLAQ